jgi:hypothetical protein
LGFDEIEWNWILPSVSHAQGSWMDGWGTFHMLGKKSK